METSNLPVQLSNCLHCLLMFRPCPNPLYAKYRWKNRIYLILFIFYLRIQTLSTHARIHAYPSTHTHPPLNLPTIKRIRLDRTSKWPFINTVARLLHSAHSRLLYMLFPPHFISTFDITTANTRASLPLLDVDWAPWVYEPYRECGRIKSISSSVEAKAECIRIGAACLGVELPEGNVRCSQTSTDIGLCKAGSMRSTLSAGTGSNKKTCLHVPKRNTPGMRPCEVNFTCIVVQVIVAFLPQQRWFTFGLSTFPMGMLQASVSRWIPAVLRTAKPTIMVIMIGRRP